MEKENYWIAFLLLGVRVVFFSLSLVFLINEVRLMFEWKIINKARIRILFNFYIDWMSFIFFRFVSLISGSVFFYRGRYIGKHERFRLFIILVLIFVFRIFFMVFRLNLVRIILGWDGLGVVSYILVVFYKNEKSSRAGIVTALMNRVGDSALLLVIAFFLEIGRWNYLLCEYRIDNLVLLLIVVAAITKRAQIPFSAWLPAAIAAPTPVRALVHSSTLVTAGVYLLIRFSEILLNSNILIIVTYLRILTTVMARVTALFEADFKKVVALSTLRQLGVIIITLSIGFVYIAFVHLLTHAIFKALLFICSGKIIHRVNDNQDIRKIGGLIFNIPVTGLIINLARIALCGVPFLSGFYSKDLIIERVIIEDTFYINYCIYLLIVGLSASYSFRLVNLGVVFEINQIRRSSSCEKDWVILSSKIGLVFISLIRGAILLWVLIPVPSIVSLILSLKWFTFLSIRLGGLIGLLLCRLDLKGVMLTKILMKVDIVMLIWNLTILRGNSIGESRILLSLSLKKLDLGWLEVFSGGGFNYLLIRRGDRLRVWSINNTKKFLVIFVFGLFLIKVW